MEFWICDVALSPRFIHQEKRIRFKKPEKGWKSNSVHVPTRVNPCKLEPGGVWDGPMEGIPGVILSFSQTNSRSGKLTIRI